MPRIAVHDPPQFGGWSFRRWGTALALALVVAALVLERACRTPDDRDLESAGWPTDAPT